MSFNPSEHLTKLQDKDYLEVKWRLVWFREKYPHGRIETEELAYDLDREVSAEGFAWNAETRRKERVLKKACGYARYRAIVEDGEGGRGVGTKSESAVNFPDFGEKAETGAIGRALAALGFGTQFAPEMDEADRIVDSPVDRTPTTPAPAQPSPERQQTAQPARPASATPTPINAPSRPATRQNAAVQKMVAQAKARAEAAGESWDALKLEACGRAVGDEDLMVAQVATINGKLTQVEKKSA